MYVGFRSMGTKITSAGVPPPPHVKEKKVLFMQPRFYQFPIPFCQISSIFLRKKKE